MFSYHFIQRNINHLLSFRLHNASILLCKMLCNKNKKQLTCVVASTDRAHEHTYSNKKELAQNWKIPNVFQSISVPSGNAIPIP